MFVNYEFVYCSKMAVCQDMMETDSSSCVIPSATNYSTALLADSEQTYEQCASVHPSEYSTCCVILKQRSAADSEFNTKSLLNLELGVEGKFVIGKSATKVQESIELRLLKLKAGDLFRFNIEVVDLTQQYSIDVTDSGVFEIQLISFSPAKNVIQMTSMEMFDRAKNYKELGNSLFKGKAVEMSFRKYNRAMKYLILIQDSLPEECEESMKEYYTLRSQCYINIAACQLQCKNFKHAAENCTKALTLDPVNIKALYRRALAYKQLGDVEECLTDLERACELDPANSAIRKELMLIKAECQNQNAHLAKAMSKMFTS